MTHAEPPPIFRLAAIVVTAVCGIAVVAFCLQVLPDPRAVIVADGGYEEPRESIPIAQIVSPPAERQHVEQLKAYCEEHGVYIFEEEAAEEPINDLELRDRFFTVALGDGFDPDVWQDPEARVTFERNRELADLGLLIVKHEDTLAEAWKEKQYPYPTLRDSINAAGGITPTPYDTFWDEVERIDREFREHLEHGDNTDAYEIMALVTLRKKVRKTEPFGPWLQEKLLRDGKGFRCNDCGDATILVGNVPLDQCRKQTCASFNISVYTPGESRQGFPNSLKGS